MLCLFYRYNAFGVLKSKQNDPAVSRIVLKNLGNSENLVIKSERDFENVRTIT